MARQSLVLDASVGVKWFSARGETSLIQAIAIRDEHIAGDVIITIPDLFFYEVANAIVHKQSIPAESVQLAVNSMFALGMNAVSPDSSSLETSVRLSRELNVTIYDACYIALAQNLGCPLVTANPRHQRQSADCDIIPLETWHPKL